LVTPEDGAPVHLLPRHINTQHIARNGGTVPLPQIQRNCLAIPTWRRFPTPYPEIFDLVLEPLMLCTTGNISARAELARGYVLRGALRRHPHLVPRPAHYERKKRPPNCPQLGAHVESHSWVFWSAATQTQTADLHHVMRPHHPACPRAPEVSPAPRNDGADCCGTFLAARLVRFDSEFRAR